MSGEVSGTRFTNVIVAVHGIGQQSRYATIRSVATRLAASTLAGRPIPIRPVAPQPLGFFHGKVRDIITATLLDDEEFLRDTALANTGFAEVFWADIPATVVKEGSTLEETKAWARTVVARAHALWLREQKRQAKAAEEAKALDDAKAAEEVKAAAKPKLKKLVQHTQALVKRVQAPGIVPPDFGLAAEVVDEVVETVYVLENLLFLADKAGLFKFDLAQVLGDYLGDVQIVTEFANYRVDIVARFHKAMADIYAEECRKGNPDVRLHIVAHSEGTVVSFLGLLYAMSGKRLKAPAANDAAPQLEQAGEIPEWLKHVHGYMTIGSPIDKHILLWPKLWEDLDLALADAALDEGQIRWRNYYDYGDPIGFRLDTARAWLDKRKSKAFEFCDCPKHRHDMGFARYLLPGKAHNDYWNDPAVFDHFVDDVICRPAQGDAPPAKPLAPKPPVDRRAVFVLSPALPYFFGACVLLAGVFLMCKAIDNFAYPEDLLTKYFLLEAIGVEPTSGLTRANLLRNTFGIAALIAGATLFARMPRLAAGRRWKLWGLLALVTGGVLYAASISWASQREIGVAFVLLADVLNSGSAVSEFGATLAWLADRLVACSAIIGATILGIVDLLRMGAPPPKDYVSTAVATGGVVILAFVAGLFGLWGTRRTRQGEVDRRERWLLKGMRPLILCGAVAVGLIVAAQLVPPKPLTHAERASIPKELATLIDQAGFDRKEVDQLFKSGKSDRLADVKPFLTTRAPVWPVILATAGFLYLWWLSTLIFDLAFVWHRYVRNSLANQRLSEWSPGGLRRSTAHEPCRITEPDAASGGQPPGPAA